MGRLTKTIKVRSGTRQIVLGSSAESGSFLASYKKNTTAKGHETRKGAKKSADVHPLEAPMTRPTLRSMSAERMRRQPGRSRYFHFRVTFGCVLPVQGATR